MQKTVFMLALLLACGSLFAQAPQTSETPQTVQQLTPQQKKRDFMALYRTMKENYPYFAMQKRAGVDWLSRKKEYLDKVKQTPNDSTYLLALNDIVRDVQEGHVNIVFGRDKWAEEHMSDPQVQPWGEASKASASRCDYWNTIMWHTTAYLAAQEAEKKDKAGTQMGSQSQPRTQPQNVTDTLLDNGRIAVMSIRSFSDIAPDSVRIDAFLRRISPCKYLIINLQDNGGGSTDYWEFIVSRLLKDTVSQSLHYIIKGGALNRRFYPDVFAEMHRVKESDRFGKMPEELFKEPYYMSIDTSAFVEKPVKPVDFDGKIYLLVNGWVFSSAEQFVRFAKETGWAVIAGERTGGDGVGANPAYILLPESKIIVRYPGFSGLNSDGAWNLEERTVPDLEIKGKTSQERLDRLVKYLEER